MFNEYDDIIESDIIAPIYIPGNMQELFDKACEFFATQQQRCYNEKGACMYRGPNGKTCVVGNWLPRYDPRIEGTYAEELMLDGIFVFEPGVLAKFVNKVQSAHDTSHDATDLKYVLRHIANRFYLNVEKINLITNWSAT